MLQKYMKIQEVVSHDSLKIERVSLNVLKITLTPPGEFTAKVFSPLFDAEVVSPAVILLIAFAQDEFRLDLTASGSSTVTMVPSLVLEVYNSSGIRVIQIIAPS
jgi:hypothetical protein